jgi:cytokinin dehydrogenase
VTRASLELRRFRPRVRTFCLLYDALPSFVEDLMVAVHTEAIDYVEAFCAGTVQGLRSTPAGRRPFSQWFYGLHVSVEHDVGAAPEPERALAGLRPYRVVNVDDDDTARFASRYDLRFEGMRRSGGWNEAHPWLEAMFTPESFVETVPRLLEMLPPALGDNHRVFPFATARTPRFFRTPDAPVVLGVGVFPVGVPRAALEDALRAVGAAHRLVVEAGAKRYLAGWLGDPDEAAWRAHYGAEWDAFRRAKQELDPRAVLRSKLFEG